MIDDPYSVHTFLPSIFADKSLQIFLEIFSKDGKKLLRKKKYEAIPWTRALCDKYSDFGSSHRWINEITINHAFRIGSFVTPLSPSIRSELTERALVNAGDPVIIGSGRFIYHGCLNRRNRIHDRNMITSGTSTQSRDYAVLFLFFFLRFFPLITRGKLTSRFLCHRRSITIDWYNIYREILFNMQVGCSSSISIFTHLKVR